MGREALEGLRVSPKPAASSQQENQQTDHFPSRYVLTWFGLGLSLAISPAGLVADSDHNILLSLSVIKPSGTISRPIYDEVVSDDGYKIRLYLAPNFTRVNGKRVGTKTRVAGERWARALSDRHFDYSLKSH